MSAKRKPEPDAQKLEDTIALLQKLAAEIRDNKLPVRGTRVARSRIAKNLFVTKNEIERIIRPKAVDTTKRLGALKGVIVVPDDIDTPFTAEIEEMFYGKDAE
ncbi:hypothetical protein ACFPU0_25385 [Pseudomonas sp. GCM10022186]|uniref:hypothetical protein n=1 Tax=Pseudomonas sp. GCM10022186 TaxID=3252650 RepID=UPI0036165C52